MTHYVFGGALNLAQSVNPGCRACNRKHPTTELGAMVSWHDEQMATCRAEPLT